ncbi:MAG: hypothetical protein ACHQDY_09055 [Solirubrobacterales bacterium]
MRAIHRRSRRSIATVALALLALGATTSMTATAAAPAPPINDNYLQSLNINKPGTALNRTEEITDVRDTTAATIQSDIFNPTSHGGPPELTGCNGTGESGTIWYDFYPDANGIVKIHTSASFGTIVAVVPFDPKSLLPDESQRHCVVSQPTAASELLENVQAGKSYTVQIGGVAGSAGSIQFLFGYFVKLKPVQAEATLTAAPLSGGVRVVSLAVAAPHRARVEVRCSRGCRPQATTARSVGFPHLRGAVLPKGSSLKIYVTAKNEIGAFIEYRIGSGKFTKTQRCLAPGSKKPKPCE